MRSNILLLFVVILLLAVVSCNENFEPEFIDTKIQDESSFINFKSLEDFESFGEKFMTMTDKELDIWENENSFTSYRTLLNEAYLQLDSLESEEERAIFIDKYKDVLTLQNDKWTPLIDIKFYQSIVNRQGFYKTDGFVNRVVGDYILTVRADDYEGLKKVKSVDRIVDSKVLNSQGIRTYRYVGFDSNSEDTRILSPCSTQMITEYFENESGCRNDRRVYLRATSFVAYTVTSEGDFYQPKVAIRVWGERRRGTWCNWDWYRTALSLRNISYTIRGYAAQSNGVFVPRSYSIAVGDSNSPSDYTYWEHNRNIGVKVLNQHITPFPFTKLHAEGTSRGVGDVWVVLDCQ